MVVRVKLKESKNPSLIHSVLFCYKHENDLIIVTAGMATLVYDSDIVETFEVV